MKTLILLFGLFVSASCARGPEPHHPADHAEQAARSSDAGGSKHLFSSSRPGDNALTITHVAREIVLTPAEPSDVALGIRLVKITPTGRVFIHVAETGEVVSATAGERFLTKRTKPYGVRYFGESALILKRVDVANSTATLEARSATYSD